jgi:hypothetical protein
MVSVGLFPVNESVCLAGSDTNRPRKSRRVGPTSELEGSEAVVLVIQDVKDIVKLGGPRGIMVIW